MINKIKRILCLSGQTILLSGIIILVTGLYYLIIKAGIPYQDPPLELQIKYTVNMEIGNILTKIGLFMGLCGGLLCVLNKIAKNLQTGGNSHG